MPVPAKLSDRLFDRLIRAAIGHHDGDIPDELEVRRLERDATGLLKTHPEDAHQILGGVAALSFDIAGMRNHHEASLRYSRSAQALANYATSLQLVGLYRDAAKFMWEASQKRQENLGYLRAACGFTLWAGELHRAMELEQLLKKRDPDGETEDAELLEGALTMMKSHGVTEHEVQVALALAFEYLIERKVRFKRIGLGIDDDQGAMFFSIIIDRPVAEVMTLDNDLATQMTERLPDLNPAVIVEFEPLPRIPASRANVGSTARAS